MSRRTSPTLLLIAALVAVSLAPRWGRVAETARDDAGVPVEKRVDSRQ